MTKGHPAVVKASAAGNLAISHGWKGQLNSEVVASHRITNLEMTRNDECFSMQWVDSKLDQAYYSIFNSVPVQITDKKQLLRFVTGWPDLIQLFQTFPNMNRPNLVRQYRRLPFDFDDENEFIIDSLVGKRIWWYNRDLARIDLDTVKPKRDKRFRIVDVGHRKLFHCVCVETKFRSVLLDQLIKVA